MFIALEHVAQSFVFRTDTIYFFEFCEKNLLFLSVIAIIRSFLVEGVVKILQNFTGITVRGDHSVEKSPHKKLILPFEARNIAIWSRFQAYMCIRRSQNERGYIWVIGLLVSLLKNKR